MSPVIKTPELPPVVAGTAGHVDHGKTSLVKLLTGCDTDRLKEEKERGMSINLGFAPCLLPGNRVVGIIDVPGHIDFIRNMVAGAASIDILILVIAADDGIMPQTSEHMQIIKLLRSPRLMVALTKTDLVDAPALEAVKSEIADFLKEHGYGDSPIIPVSNITFDGIDQIRSALDGMVSSVMRETDTRAFRMNIERVFSVKGFGTVVSGIPLSGKISIGDEVELLPSGKRTSVKSIQNYKHNTDNTYASVCSAINLKDIPAEEISRGMTIATPGYFRPAKFAAVELMNISKDFPIKNNTEFKFHAGTSEVSAKVSLFGKSSIEPGATAAVRLKFNEEVSIASGDRFVLRRLSPSTTIGGGVVISSSGTSIKINSEDRIYTSMEFARNNNFFEAEVLCGVNYLLEHAEAVRLSGLMPQAAEMLLKEKVSSGFLAVLNGGHYLVLARRGELSDRIRKGLEIFHKNQKQLSGMDTETFCSTFDIKAANFARIIEIFISETDSEIKIINGKVALKSFAPAASSRIMQLKDKLLALIEKSGINCVAHGTILETGAITEQELKSVIKMLVDEKLIVVIGNHIISMRTFEDCRKKIADIIARKGLLEVGDFREATGASRNMSVALLEKFDGLGFTKRLPKGRVLLKGK
ncbi:MAG: selenocysteine-specific translation elongation factor [Lentisphaerae bacterium GWF2_50_93]|nr:MAG: selenocysteine-specific translation elongation factor [Lentisphaerae bacterium GWF2_50_93]